MEQINVTFEDGATERLPAGITAREALLAHARNGGGNRKQVERAIAARVENGAGPATVIDLSRALANDCRVGPVVPDSADGLDVLRHSSAHLMAQAVKRLFPETEITIGPVIENGFYYDFKRPGGFVAEDLPRIEETMRAIVKEDIPVRREEVAKAEAIRRFRDMGEHYKVEIIEGIPEPTVSLYHQGEFVDLCRGPHVPSTGRIPAFRLTSLAGAYWRGDARNEQLQRIYGTAWASVKDLEAYLARVEEAKQRDHRRIGQALDLFSLHPIAPGSPFFHPKGAVVYNLLVQFVRGLYARYAYSEVITPLVYKTELYKTSGHYELFKDDMFLLTVEEEEYGVKPMNCPGHCYLYAIGKHSYRDLPIRYADFSRLHRFEPSGTLAGLTRVRSMSQDDAHIYCTPEQLDDELDRFIAMTREVYSAFAFSTDRMSVTLQTRPEKFLGRVELWDAAERALQRAVEKAGFVVTPLPGQGAFYGPKIGFDFRDVLERTWTLATVQIDCAMPERFGLRYVTPEGTEATPVMIHRAVLGTLERFIAILLEHTAGKLPLWLAPVQVRVLPVSEKVAEYAAAVADACRTAGLRAEADLRNEKLGYKVREAQLAKVPVIAVVGEREAGAGTVAPRSATPGQEAVPLAEFVARTAAEGRVPGGAA
jgi:threonyl-tRNA synthetase